MKIIKFAAIVVLSVATVGTVAAVEFTRGVVTKVDAEQKKVTVKHEELTNLDMPAMTMVFNVADEAMLEKATEGSNIEFIADRVRGKMTIVDLK